MRKKYISNIIRILLGFFILFPGKLLTSQEYNTQFYTTHNGLAENEVRDIFQDRDGFFWFATGNGVSRFDGNQFVSYGFDEGITNPLINIVIQDTSGIIWIQGRQDVYYLIPGNNKFQILEDAHLKQITSISLFPNNQIILSSNKEGFFAIKDFKLTEIELDKAYSGKIVHRNTFNQGDSLYFVNINDRIYQYKYPSQMTFIGVLPLGKLNNLFIKNNILYMASTEGAFLFDLNKRIFEPLLPSTTPYNCLDVTMDSFGYLWLATNRGLLFRSPETETFKYFKSNTMPYISGSWYWKVFEDNVQNLWFSPAGFGVGKLNYRFFVNYTRTSGLYSSVYWLFQPTEKGGMILAGPNGLLEFNSMKNFPIEGDEYLVGYDIRYLALGKRNTLYLIINNLGFYSYNLSSGELKKLLPNPQNPSLVCFSLIRDSETTYILGTDNGLYRYENGNFFPMLLPGKTKDITIWEIAKENSGNIWFGTSNGLYAYHSKNKNWRHWGIEEGLKYLNVKSIQPTENGNVWVAYFEAGGVSKVNFQRNRIEKEFTRNNGLPTNKVFSIAYDHKKQLWLGTAHGLCRISGEKIEVFDVNQGLLWIDFWRNASYVDNDNSVWFATSLGLSKFDPRYEIYPKQGLKMTINEAAYGEDRPKAIGSETIAYKDNYIHIRYSALNFKSEKDIDYYYRLLPLDKDWKHAPKGEIEFRSLPADKYTFQVKAKALGRGWSNNIASMFFEIDPPFYLTRTFVFLLVLFVIAGTWLYVWIRTRNVLARNILLNNQIAARTKDLGMKNEQLQKLLNKLQKTQAQLVHSEKMASLGILSSGLAHEVNNPLSYTLSNALYLKNELTSILESFPDLPDEILGRYNEMLEASTLIVEGSNRVVDVVQNLQSFAKPQEADYKKANLNQNIETTVKLVKNRYRDRIEFLLNLDEKVPDIYCYPSLMNQVFLNLIINATQAIKEKGTISIESKQHNYKNIIITIEDTGEGISEDIKTRIYDPFFTTKPVGKGTGLGLAISHSIVEGKHKGSLTFTSEVGKGTRFIIELPADLPVKPEIHPGE